MNNYSTFYQNLNCFQKEAVDAIAGPLLVLAGPGTGKTQLLSVRAASIIRNSSPASVRPENILILTYTNSAAKAMKERLARVMGTSGYDVEVGTFHSFANSMLLSSAEAANYVADRIPMNEVEQAQALEYALDNTAGVDEIRPFRSPYIYLREIQQKISDLKKDGIRPYDLEQYLAKTGAYYHQMEDKHIKRLHAFSLIYKKYEEIKTGSVPGIFDERGRYDFDDMIIFAAEALKNESQLHDEYRRQYTHVMVDEFQDTNGAQLELLFTLLDYKAPNLCCVGDDDQSIYRFQGASVANFKLLKDRFPGLKTIQLKDNYRSSEDLIRVSAAVINTIPAGERVEQKRLKHVRDFSRKEILYKELTTEEEELLYIVDKVKEIAGYIKNDPDISDEDRRHPYNNIAVLVRKRKQILKIIDAFLQSGIPYATDGKEDIGGEKRVGQLLDVLELARIDPKDCELKDLVLYKVLTADYFEIPQADILKFVLLTNEKKKKNHGVTLLSEFLSVFGPDGPGGDAVYVLGKPDRMRHAADVLGTLLRDAASEPVHKLLLDFINGAGIFAFVLREYGDNGMLRIRQLRSIGSFVNVIKASDMANPGIRLEEFLTELKTRMTHNLPIQGNLVTLSQAGVRIYTAHGSKGLEFHSVIIPFCLQNRSWPMRPMADRILLPFDLFRTREKADEKDALRKLALQDETRLFYVAMTRTKSNLIFTASPSGDSVPTSFLDDLDVKKDVPSGAACEEAVIEKSLHVSGAQDPFIGTNAVLADMIANLTLNPTRLNNYITCRRKFLYNDVLKLPGQKKKSLVFGNCVHKALEETFKEYKSTRSFPSFDLFEKEFLKELTFQGVDTAMERDCRNRMGTLKGWFSFASKNPVIPIDLEKKLIVTIGDDIIFNGKYDKVEWDDEEQKLVRIIDYKTGKPDAHIKDIDACADLSSRQCDGYLRQLVAYKLLFERDKKESKGRRVSRGVLVFIEPLSMDIKKKSLKKGEYATKAVAISDEMVRELEHLIESTWDNIRKLRFEKLEDREEDTCGNCDFNSICWG